MSVRSVITDGGLCVPARTLVVITLVIDVLRDTKDSSETHGSRDYYPP